MDPELLASLLRYQDAPQDATSVGDDPRRRRKRRSLAERIREGVRGIPGYETVRDAALGTAEAVGDFALGGQQLLPHATRTASQLADSPATLLDVAGWDDNPARELSDYLAETAREQQEALGEPRSGYETAGRVILGEIAPTVAEYAGTVGGVRKGLGMAREVAEQGAPLARRAAVGLREAGRDALAALPLDAALESREETSTARAIADLAPETGVGRLAERASGSWPGRVAFGAGLGVGADLGIRGVGMVPQAGREAVEGLVGMGERGSVVNPLRLPGQTEQGMPGIWRSPVREVIEKSQPSAPAEQWRGILARAPKAEQEWAGLDEFLSSKSGNVSRDEILAHLDQNGIRLTESVRGAPRNLSVAEAKDVIARGGRIHGVDPQNSERISGVTLDDGSLLPHVEANPGSVLLREGDPDAVIGRRDAGPKFAQYTQGNFGQRPESNYREILLRVEDRGAVRRAQILAQMEEIAGRPSAEHISNPALMQAWDRLNAERQSLDARPPIKFRSSHWDEPNVLAHLRTTDRNVGGQKTLFVEEVQSDWHRSGRERGYKGAPDGDLAQMMARQDDLRQQSSAILEEGRAAGRRGDYRQAVQPDRLDEYERLITEHNDLTHRISAIQSAVPDAPLKKPEEWVGLTLRRALQEAVQGGYDRIAWANGRQVADLYDLRKQVSEILYNPRDRQLVVYGPDGDEVLKRGASPEELPELIGKEPARRLLESAPGARGAGWHSVEGDDLAIGGEWATSLYDRVIPNIMRKEAKRLGLEIEPARIAAEGSGDVRVVEFPSGHWVVEDWNGQTRKSFTPEAKSAAEEYAARLRAEAPAQAPENLSLRITPEARAKVQGEGHRLGAVLPEVSGAIGRAAAGSVVGGLAAPEGQEAEGALAGAALAGGAPLILSRLARMDEGGFAAFGRDLVSKFRQPLKELSDAELLERYRKYQRGQGRTGSDAEAAFQQDAVRGFTNSGDVIAGTADRQAGRHARGRDTQQQARIRAAELELEARGLEVPREDPYLDPKPSDVLEGNRALVEGLAGMSDRELHAAIIEAAPKANPSNVEATERMALLVAEAGRQGRDVSVERALRGEPPIERPGIAPAFQKAPTPPDARIVALRKADAAEIRRSLGLDELPEGERLSMQEAWDESMERGMAGSATLAARDAMAAKRGLRPVEHAAAVQRLLELEVELGSSRFTLEEATRAGNDETVRREMLRTQEILDEFDTLTEAVTRTGSESARSLAARRWLKANADNWTLANGLQQARTAKGAALVTDEVRVIEELSNRIESLDAENLKLRTDVERLAVVKQEQLALAVAETEARQAARAPRGPNRMKALQTENVDIKAKLAKLGVRLNDLTGVSAEGVYLIGRLAANHIQQAVLQGSKAELDEIVQRVLSDLNNPQITARDVYEAMNARSPRAVSAARKETARQVAQLKSQAKLLTQVEDAERGIFQQGRKRPTTASEIQKLRDRLKELRTAAYASSADQRRLELTLQTINDLEDQLANHHRTVRSRKPIPSEEMANLQTRVRGLRQEMRVEDRLADLQEQLQTGAFKVPVPRETLYTSPALERNQIALKNAKRQWRDAIDAMAKPTGRQQLAGAANFLRTVKATADMSATLRQGLWLSTSRPATAMRAFGQSARAFFSSVTADQIDNAIRQHPNQLMRDMAGLQLADLDGPVAKREEMFASKLAERIPVFGEMVKASNRSMTTTLNLLRSAAFDEFAVKFPNATSDELKAWANWVNVASGRGDLGPLKPIGTELSAVVFAPRFTASRIQTPFMVLRHWQEPRVRQMIARDYAATVGLGLTALTLADMAGLDVGVDPRESDFGKIRFDDTRVDLWGGVQQPVRLIARAMLQGTDRAGLTGDHLRDFERQPDPLGLLGQFAQFKLAPAVTMPVELWSGRTAVGEPVTPSETAVRAVLPLVWEDVFETYRLAGPEAAATSGALNFLGASTQTFGDSENVTRRKIRQSMMAGDQAAARQMLAKWNRANPTNPIRQVR